VIARLAAAVAAAAVMQPLTPPLRSLDRGTSSQIRTERLAVARDESEWARLWTAHAPTRPQPAVDFARESVVAVFAGTRPTAGYAVAIDGYRENAGTIVVVYREAAPAPGTIAAQVITSPFAIATVPRRPGEIDFERASQ
jgi:hypothetical protein